MKIFTSIISILILITQNAFAVVYRTITNGLMEDASIWVPALPPYPLPNGDTIIIENTVDMNVNCKIEGVMIINAGCCLQGLDKTLNIESTGMVIVNGLLKVKNIDNNGLLINNARVEIYGDLLNNGSQSFIEGTNGVFRLQNRTINNAGGNISGTVDFCRFDEVSDPLLTNSGTVDWSTVTVCNSPPLPLKFLSFMANEMNDGIIIEWTTAEEKDNSHFELEKSFDAIQFSVLSIVNAVENNDGTNYYKVYDAANNYDEIYYRIKQVDIDGSYEYSNIVSISPDNKFDMSIYPNPADNNTAVFFSINNYEKNSELLIIITDQCGQEKFHKTVTKYEERKFEVNENSLNKPGIYFVLVSYGDNTYRKKLVVR